MHWLWKMLIAVLGNALGLWVAARYIPQFTLAGGLLTLFILSFALAILNFVLKPILKLVLGPIIILTLGLGLIIVNALILYILDKFSTNLTIGSIPALLYSTLLIGIINFVFHLIP